MSPTVARNMSNDSHVIPKVSGSVRIDSPTDWPRFSVLPDGEHLTCLVERVKQHVRPSIKVRSAQALADTVGCAYRLAPIGGEASTIESLLVPLRTGGFSIVINSRQPRSEPEKLWLAAHEIAHSFFYVPGSPPRRIVRCTPAEERFCDAFADALLDSDVPSARLRVA